MLVFIIESLSESEKKFINELFKNHHIKFYNISLGILKSHPDAEDAVSQAFLKILDRMERISRLPCSQIVPYCVTIVKNESFNILRRQKKDYRLEEKLLPEDDEYIDPAYESILSDTVGVRDKLRNAISALNNEERLFVQLRFAKNMSLREIADIFGISEDAAKKRSQRILKKLRTIFEEEGRSLV